MKLTAGDGGALGFAGKDKEEGSNEGSNEGSGDDAAELAAARAEIASLRQAVAAAQAEIKRVGAMASKVTDPDDTGQPSTTSK